VADKPSEQAADMLVRPTARAGAAPGVPARTSLDCSLLTAPQARRARARAGTERRGRLIMPPLTPPVVHCPRQAVSVLPVLFRTDASARCRAHRLASGSTASSNLEVGNRAKTSGSSFRCPRCCPAGCNKIRTLRTPNYGFQLIRIARVVLGWTPFHRDLRVPHGRPRPRRK
jgi:hypothetical protein